MTKQEQPTYSNTYKGYVLLILTGVYTFNFIDRQILVILQESIKSELGLSDTQLGLLTGLTFALFYVTLGIPIARLADKSNRRNIVALSLAVWSAMTALSGLAANFTQLLLARIGVGVGEAGGSPPSHSMISDYFPPEKRATALSIYSVGIYIGILVGYSLGGWLDQNYGWRIALMALGIPGIVYALLLLITVKEPPKGLSDAIALKKEKGTGEKEDPSILTESSFGDVVKLLLSKKTFVFLALGCGFRTFGNYGVGNFFAPFLARVHNMDSLAIGAALGLATGVGGMIGTFAGGFLADKLGKKDIRWYLWIAVVAEFLIVIPSYVAFFSDNTSYVLYMFFLTSLFSAIYLGPCIAVTHNLVNAKMRALSSAILFLVLNLIGLGLGPLGIGWISDYLAPTYGVESLRYSFCFSFITGGIALVLFWLAAKSYPEDLRKSQALK